VVEEVALVLGDEEVVVLFVGGGGVYLVKKPRNRMKLLIPHRPDFVK
jgi:hypothetical protein